MNRIPYKVVLIVILLAFLCSGCTSLVSTNSSPQKNDFDTLLSSGITPTPAELPATESGSYSIAQSIVNQILHPANKNLNPDLYIKNSQASASSEHFMLFVQKESLPVKAAWLEKAEQIYGVECKRVGSTLDKKIVIQFIPPEKGNCAPRGTTLFEEQPIILIYANQDTNPLQINATFAHELGHVFIHNKYENLNNIALNEGMATWIAQEEWTIWKGNSFDDSVRSSLKENSYLSIYQNFNMQKAYANSPGCLGYRDQLLTEFASFIDYLIQKYGMGSLTDLFNMSQPDTINNQRVTYAPDFLGVYGLSLNQLEFAWLTELTNQ